jgi:hypothetical protein
MEVIIYIVFILCAFIESVFGFAGTITALAIIGIFVDMKIAILLGLFFGLTLSIYILLSDIKSFDYTIYLKVILPAIPGVIIGSYVIELVSVHSMKLFFGLFLVVFTIYTIFKLQIPKILENFLLIINGLIHGLLGVGGPIPVAIYKNKINKSSLRSTFAVVFITMNVMRIVQYSIQKTYNFKLLLNYWLLPFLLLVPAFLGYKIHVKISEKNFRLGLSIILLIIGLYFLIRSFIAIT